MSAIKTLATGYFYYNCCYRYADCIAFWLLLLLEDQLIYGSRNSVGRILPNARGRKASSEKKKKKKRRQADLKKAAANNKRLRLQTLILYLLLV